MAKPREQGLLHYLCCFVSLMTSTQKGAYSCPKFWHNVCLSWTMHEIQFASFAFSRNESKTIWTTAGSEKATGHDCSNVFSGIFCLDLCPHWLTLQLCSKLMDFCPTECRQNFCWETTNGFVLWNARQEQCRRAGVFSLSLWSTRWNRRTETCGKTQNDTAVHVQSSCLCRDT